MIKKSKRVLVVSSAIVLPLMIGVFYITTQLLGTRPGYFAGLAIYWIFCICTVIFILNHSDRKLIDIYIPFLKSKRAIVFSWLAFVPVLLVCFVQFIPYLSSITTGLFLLVTINAVINGIVEELYWRGLYLIEYSQNRRIGFWYSSILFGAWHIALYTIGEISYGGFFALVGGALFMGFIWSISARKSNSILFTTLAHVLVNLFAFTGFFVENGFDTIF